MNSKHIDHLQKNYVFKNLLLNTVSRNKLATDLVSLGNYTDDYNDVLVGKCTVECTSTFNNWSKIFDTLQKDMIQKTNNIVLETNKIAPIIRLYKSQNIIEKIFIENVYHFKINEIYHYKYSNHLLYVFLYALYPNIINISKNRLDLFIQSFCEELVFQISDHNMFKHSRYKKMISLTKLQNQLLDFPNIQFPYHILTSILSDYFNINIILFVEKLIIRNTYFDESKLCLLLTYKHNKFYVICNGEYPLIHPKIYLKIENAFHDETQFHPIFKLEKISKYKSTDIQQLSKLLNINITINSKKRKKEEVYDDIKNLLPMF